MGLVGKIRTAELSDVPELAAIERAAGRLIVDIPWNGPFYASMDFETLTEDDLDEALAEALAHEQEIGLTRRIAMFRSGEGAKP